MTLNKKYQQGFTLMEIMIVIAIIGILVSIAIPSYKSYTRRAHYSEIVQMAAPYKMAVEECFALTGGIDDCQSGNQGVPPAFIGKGSSSLVDEIKISKGVISIVPQDKYGIAKEDTYILSPKIENDSLSWHSSGGGVEKGYAQ